MKEAGAEQVQIDEPVLVLDLPEAVQSKFKEAYDALVGADVPELILTTYFGDVRPNLKAIENLPVAGFHFDFVRVPEQLDEVASILKDGQTLSAGVVDGRNIWKTDFAKASAVVQKLLKSW